MKGNEYHRLLDHKDASVVDIVEVETVNQRTQDLI